MPVRLRAAVRNGARAQMLLICYGRRDPIRLGRVGEYHKDEHDIESLPMAAGTANQCKSIKFDNQLHNANAGSRSRRASS